MYPTLPMCHASHVPVGNSLPPRKRTYCPSEKVSIWEPVMTADESDEPAMDSFDVKEEERADICHIGFNDTPP